MLPRAIEVYLKRDEKYFTGGEEFACTYGTYFVHAPFCSRIIVDHFYDSTNHIARIIVIYKLFTVSSIFPLFQCKCLL